MCSKPGATPSLHSCNHSSSVRRAVEVWNGRRGLGWGVQEAAVVVDWLTLLVFAFDSLALTLVLDN